MSQPVSPIRIYALDHHCSDTTARLYYKGYGTDKTRYERMAAVATVLRRMLPKNAVWKWEWGSPGDGSGLTVVLEDDSLDAFMAETFDAFREAVNAVSGIGIDIINRTEALTLSRWGWVNASCTSRVEI